MAYVPELLVREPAPDTVSGACERINRNFENIALQFTALPSTGDGGSFDYSKILLTGGSEDALDHIDGDSLTGGETAVCVVGVSPAAVYFYVLNAESGAAESVPNVIAPDTNAGAKRWVLIARVPRIWVGTRTPTVSDDRNAGVVNGEAWVYNNAIWFCADNTSGAAVWQKLVKIGTTAGTACDGADSRLSDAREPTVHDNAKHSTAYAAQSDLTTHTGATAPHSGHEVTSAKGVANGYPSLDGNAKIPTSQIPAIAITDRYPVASEAEMLALTCERGDYAFRSDDSQVYILAGDDPSVLSNWVAWLYPGGGVISVDDRSGIVSLSDLYAPVGKGVTNGDSHDHSGGDGAQIDHTTLTSKGTNTHDQIDTAITNSANHIAATAPHSGHEETAKRGVASGYASLDASGTVEQDPASKGVASGVAGLDASGLVPTVQLGGSGASSSNFLRGDQTWAAVEVTMPAGTILQVISVVKTDTFSASVSTFTDITGISATITPSSTSSKVLVFVNVYFGTTSSGGMMSRLVRGSTSICIGDNSSSRTSASSAGTTTNTLETINHSIMYLDTPGTTDATTYKLQGVCNPSGGGSSFCVNRSCDDGDNSNAERVTSTITLIEIKG